MKITMDDLQKKIKTIKSQDPKCLDIALDDLAVFMHLEASRLVPVSSGTLRKSINIKRRKMWKSIGTNIEYARWIEYGEPIGGKTTHQYFKGDLVPRSQVTHPLGPKPYLRPAFTKGTANDNEKLKEYFELCLGEI